MELVEKHVEKPANLIYAAETDKAPWYALSESSGEAIAITDSSSSVHKIVCHPDEIRS
jgi:hypothetical protein